MKKLNKEAPKFRTQGLLLMFISIICIVFMICGILATHAANAASYTGPVNYNNTSTGVPGTLASGDTVTSTGKPGVYINGVNARVTLPNVGVTANNYYGVYINGGASADITDGSRVNTIGNNAFGVIGFGSIANIRDSVVTTNGLGAHGVYARDNSTIVKGAWPPRRKDIEVAGREAFGRAEAEGRNSPSADAVAKAADLRRADVDAGRLDARGDNRSPGQAGLGGHVDDIHNARPLVSRPRREVYSCYERRAALRTRRRLRRAEPPCPRIYEGPA